MTKEELEKEALEKYKTGSYPQLHPDHYAFIHGYLASAEPRKKRIAELEQENAELKKEVEQKQHLADVRVEQSLENYKLFSDERKKRIDTDVALEDMTDKLTKAKEIIKNLMEFAEMDCREYEEEYKEAEQFIEEIK